jgi:hypothetical protein
MDHVPMPPEPYNPIIIPYYEPEKKFDGGDLLTFLGRCGRKVTDFLANKEQFLDRRSLDDVKIFMEETNSRLSDDWKREHGDILEHLIKATKVFSKILSEQAAALEPEDSKKVWLVRVQEYDDDKQPGSENSRSHFWVDGNLSQTFEYIRKHNQEHLLEDKGLLVTYCWRLVLQTLAFCIFVHLSG